MQRRKGQQSQETYKRSSFKRRNCVFTVCYTLLAVFALGVSFFMITAYVGTNTVPLAVLTVGGLTASNVNQQFEDALAIEDKTSKEFTDFVETVNVFEDTWNFIMTGYQMLIIVWNLSLGLLYILFQIFLDIAFAIFKFVFGGPLKDVAMDILLWCVEAFRVIVNAGAKVLGNSASFGAANTNVAGETEGVVFGAGVGDPTAPITEFFVWLFNISVKGMTNLIIALGDDMSDLLDMIFNVFFKYLGKFLKTVTKLLETFDVTKLGGKWIKDVTGMFSKITKYLDPSCWGNILQNYSTCILQDLARQGLGGLISVVKGLCSCNIKNPIPKCNTKNIENPCSGSSEDTVSDVDYKQLAAAGDDPTFMAGLCDEIQCFEDVSDLLGVFRDINKNCSFWTSSVATSFCISSVRDYSMVNSTSIADEDIETIGAELCLVVREQVLRRCDIGADPFSFDIDFVADEICIEDKSGAPKPFNDVCACQFDAPLCDDSCCDQYARHIHGQVLDQLSDRTCGEVLSLFPEDDVWCPFMHDTSSSILDLGDYGYTHVICNYYHKVIQPLCGNPLLKVRDLPIGGAVDAYVADTCMRLVDTVGVCIPVNTSVSDITLEMIEFQGDVDVEDIFASNNLREFEPVPIVTTFSNSASASEIVQATLNKYFCQQYSIINNNTNPIFAVQTWSVHHAIGRFCDSSVAIALYTVDLSRDVTTKLRDSNGDLITGDLEGVPSGTPVFGSAVQEDDCMGNTGSNPDEVNEQFVCTAQFQMEMNVKADVTTDQADESLLSLGLTSLEADDMNHISGIQGLDPDDPEYERKMREMEELELTASVTTDWETDDKDSLRNETAPFRRNFPQPPPDGDFDDNNPFAGIFGDPAPGGRTTLSIDYDEELASPQPSRSEMWKGFFQGIIDAIETKKEKRRVTADDLKGKTKRDLRADKHARKQRKKLDMLVQTEVMIPKSQNDTSQAEQEAVFTSKGRTAINRRLQSFDDPVRDSQATSLLAQLRDIPDTLERTTPSRFQQHQADTATSRMDYMAQHLKTTVIPHIFNLFYKLTNNGTDALFGASGSTTSGETKCRATRADPYQCCDSDTDAYQCCRGLLFCFPLLPDWVIIDRTTAENIAKWECKEYDTFFEYWYTSLRVIITVPINIVIDSSGPAKPILEIFLGWLAFEDDDIPENTIGCIFVKSAFFWFGLIGIFGFYLLLSLQLVSELTIYYQKDTDSYRQEMQMQMIDTEVRDMRAELETVGALDRPNTSNPV